MEGQSQGLGVLIADDNVDAAQAFATLMPYLSGRPMVALVAFDGQQSARLATGTARPHVVVMDIEMPFMNGCEAASAIKLVTGDS
jgi:CheY-like chemotaxis protein